MVRGATLHKPYRKSLGRGIRGTLVVQANHGSSVANSLAPWAVSQNGPHETFNAAIGRTWVQGGGHLADWPEPARVAEANRNSRPGMPRETVGRDGTVHRHSRRQMLGLGNARCPRARHSRHLREVMA